MKGNRFLMHQKGKISASLPLIAAMLFQTASADTQLNITGTIKASPCNVNVPVGGVNVDLGQNIMAATLAEAESATDWKPISIEINNCPAATTSATMTLNGTVDTIKPEMYKNTGTASNVQIELQSTTGDALGNASTMIQTINTATRGAIFSMQARAYSSTGNATPGTIAGVVQLTFTYQ